MGGGHGDNLSQGRIILYWGGDKKKWIRREGGGWEGRGGGVKQAKEWWTFSALKAEPTCQVAEPTCQVAARMGYGTAGGGANPLHVQAPKATRKIIIDVFGLEYAVLR